ncbi:PTS system, Lactose/Cellobiose specific IIA subunit [Lentilactobacillus parafarraginis F0439]|uniref:PTS system, Lactose/Cellobiose specific IIA subunit n=1 Tax=Lentilactobacillus parafarraginis F0439 TaxID=797515 RepID=G9ZRV1_9LACO|nr:PTS lactose/cellobiose transporter subunit IIA [Lentilactobacillus parafarraginis]EHL96237.1 PTS system, Lactose/Cellobiose specific IIA subunit [Lentilactobacillus parafarraginis F0439]
MTDDDRNQIAMTMLLAAGHAKQIISAQLDHLTDRPANSDEISRQMATAHQWLVKAHVEQNKLMKDAERVTYSLLLTHAQDTLMNTETIYFLVSKLLPLLEK